MDLINKLTEYGLTDREASVYLASMELGPSPVQKIAQQAKLNRVSVYALIEDLQKKGLMGTFDQGKKTMYVASSPETISQFIDQQKLNLEAKKDDLKKSLPELLSRYNASGGRPVVRYYEGLDAVLPINIELSNLEFDKIYTTYDLDLIDKYLDPKLIESFKSARIRKDKPIVILYNSSTRKLGDAPMREHYQVPKEYNFPSDMAIYGDSVRFISFGDKVSLIVIEDKQIVQTIKSLFRLAMENVKKLNN